MNTQDQDTYTAGLIIIGNEILSGRTQDKNTAFIAGELNKNGIQLLEVKVVPDDETTILESVLEYSKRFSYVFTTGGIGPTHDDITAACIAKAFDLELKQDEEAYEILLDHYGKEDLTDARLKMAQIPKGAALIENPVSAAPGFIVENVHVMAGVPSIMQAMFEGLVVKLAGGRPLLSNTVTCGMAESDLAAALSKIQDDHDGIDIGSYPNFRISHMGVSVVIRGPDEDPVKSATEQVYQSILDLDGNVLSVSLQVPIDM